MKKLLWIPLMILFFSCEKGEVDHGQPIDSIIEIEMTEASLDNSGKIVLNCKTQKEYECFNYVIEYDRAGESAPFMITFQSVSLDSSGKCATAIGPARAEINLGILANGIYAIELNHGSSINRGILEVTDQELVLNIPQQKGVQILTPVVQR